ncbi:MAG: hypothetical protein SFV53_04370 [Rickettsiales bacterium]|nr:hypothetical protein [Rickettsiales bacterium]
MEKIENKSNLSDDEVKRIWLADLTTLDKKVLLVAYGNFLYISNIKEPKIDKDKIKNLPELRIDRKEIKNVTDLRVKELENNNKVDGAKIREDKITEALNNNKLSGEKKFAGEDIKLVKGLINYAKTLQADEKFLEEKKLINAALYGEAQDEKAPSKKVEQPITAATLAAIREVKNILGSRT